MKTIKFLLNTFLIITPACGVTTILLDIWEIINDELVTKIVNTLCLFAFIAIVLFVISMIKEEK